MTGFSNYSSLKVTLAECLLFLYSTLILQSKELRCVIGLGASILISKWYGYTTLFTFLFSSTA